jgi:hypothetical protein
MNPFAGKIVAEIREMWQARALRESHGRLQRALLVVFAKEYAAALPVLLRVAVPGFEDIKRPFLSGYATIMQSGRVVCDMTCDDGVVRKTAVYDAISEFIHEMRAFADQLKLDDTDRKEMFALLQRWVVADLRIDPIGRKLAS